MARKNHPYTAKAKGWLRIKKKSLEENVLKIVVFMFQEKLSNCFINTKVAFLTPYSYIQLFFSASCLKCFALRFFPFTFNLARST